jgi:hypothetical protein
MRNILLASLFILATLAWAAAQQPGAMPHGSPGQSNPPSAQMPDATQSQPTMPGNAGQQPGTEPGAQPETSQPGAQAGSQNPMASGPVTEGCLGGSSPNYTITDEAGKTYKLNIPAGADASVLAAHLGEPVAVMGAVNGASANNASIDVTKIGRGTAKCPAGNSSGEKTPPKQ